MKVKFTLCSHDKMADREDRSARPGLFEVFENELADEEEYENRSNGSDIDVVDQALQELDSEDSDGSTIALNGALAPPAPHPHPHHTLRHNTMTG